MSATSPRGNCLAGEKENDLEDDGPDTGRLKSELRTMQQKLQRYEAREERLKVISLGSSLYRISRMGGGSPGGLGRVLFYIEEIKKFAFFFKLENFQKMFKKSMKNLQF